MSIDRLNMPYGSKKVNMEHIRAADCLLPD